MPAMISLPCGSLATAGPGSLGIGRPEAPKQTAGTSRPPRFLGNPRWPRRLLKTPAGPPSQARTGEQARPPHARTAGAPAIRPNFGAEWAGSDTRCLRFARGVAPQDARLASGCWPDSTGWALCPTGFLRKVSSMLLTSLSPFPRLNLAQAHFGREVRSRKHFDANSPQRVGPTDALYHSGAGGGAPGPIRPQSSF